MKLLSKRIEKSTQIFPVFAGMKFSANSKTTTKHKIHKVGVKIVEFTYDVDIYEGGYEDWMLIDQKTIKTKITA